MATTSAERFFFNGDLLTQLVDDGIEDSDRFAIALLCKACCDVALDRLWRHVDRLSSLVNILAPLEPVDAVSDPPVLEFRRIPRPQDWARFRIYARRIRTLRFEDNHHEEDAVRAFGLLSPHIFEQLARMNPGGPLLPNLSRLEWNASKTFMPYCTLFLHPELREIRIGYSALEGVDFPAPSDIIHEIVSRAPNVERLYINALFGQRHLVDEILKVLPKLPKLVSLALPRLWITSDAISQFKTASVRKEEMEIIPYPSSYDHVGDANNVRDFLYQLDSNYIPGLQRLTVDASLDDIFYLVDSPDHPQHLQSLTINTPLIESPSMVHDFLALCAQNLPELITLNLKLVPLVLEEDYNDPLPIYGPLFITAQTLLPLYDFPNLRNFKLDSLTPVDISEGELYSLIQNWTHLESFSLTPQPIIETFPSQLTLGALIPFMAYCPNLVSLALWVDATRLPTLSFYQPTTPTSPIIRFPPSFRTLDLGTSTINEVDTTLVANYIAHYLPPYQGQFTINQAADVIEDYQPQLKVRNRFPLFGWTPEQADRANMWFSIAIRLPGLVLMRDVNA